MTEPRGDEIGVQIDAMDYAKTTGFLKFGAEPDLGRNIDVMGVRLRLCSYTRNAVPDQTVNVWLSEESARVLANVLEAAAADTDEAVPDG